jgi:curved DNA-binding protein CbpA
MLPKRDYYEVLGVNSTATLPEMKAACERVVLEVRSSGGPTAYDRLLEVRRAYTVLSDPAKRAEYERSGRQGVKENSPSFAGFNLHQHERGSYLVADRSRGPLGALDLDVVGVVAEATTDTIVDVVADAILDMLL